MLNTVFLISIYPLLKRGGELFFQRKVQKKMKNVLVQMILLHFEHISTKK